MCGRYRLTANERWLSRYFNLDPEDVDWAARWNLAPTQEVATIRQDRKEPKRKFSLMRWGLIPYWTLLAKSHMTHRPSCAKAELRVGAGRIPLQ